MNLLSIFTRSKPIVTVQTFKTKKTDLERIQEEKHRQLAKELGMPWPLIARKVQ